MTLDEAMQMVIINSAVAMNAALKARQAILNGSPIAEQRVSRVILTALDDPQATFSTEDQAALRKMLATLMPNETRTDDLRIRLTPTEKAQIERDAEAAGLSVSAYVRSRLGIGE